MSKVAPNAVCQDPGRSFVYDHFSSFFVEETDTKTGTCAICGATGMSLADPKKGFCLAQKTLTRKGHLVEEGYPVDLDSPRANADRRGYNSILDKKVTFLVRSGSAVFNRRFAPTRPLPGTVEYRAGTVFEDLLEEVMVAPKPPYVIGEFDRQATMRIEISDSENEIVINGTAPPIRLDRTRLLELVGLLEDFGEVAFKVACDMRSLSQTNKSAALKAQDYLRKSAPLLIERIEQVPNGPEPESVYAKRIIARRKRKLKIAEASSAATAKENTP